MAQNNPKPETIANVAAAWYPKEARLSALWQGLMLGKKASAARLSTQRTAS